MVALEPHPTRERAPYWHIVPQKKWQNLQFRQIVLQMAKDDPRVQHQFRCMCSRDPLFYIGVFGFSIDPRITRGEKVQPFIPYEYQQNAILKIHEAIDDHLDVGVEKSRDTGATWTCLFALDHPFLFRRMCSFTVASRNEDLVDKADEPDCLFAKLDHIHEHLPPWLRPPLKRRSMHLTNILLGSTINGMATVANLGRGGRQTAIMLDEFAAFEIKTGFESLKATQFNTGTRIFNSTHKGTATAHYQQIKKPTTVALRFGWWDHPEHCRGLYKWENGELNKFDDFNHPHGYKFIKDGKLRAPYYDFEAGRLGTASAIAEELDIDPHAAGSPLVPMDEIEKLLEMCADPYRVGRLEYDPEDCKPTRFTEDADGPLSLWFYPDTADRVPLDRKYVIGCDVSGAKGEHTSNSAACVWDQQTREKTAQLVTNQLRPELFANLVVALGHWFNKATLIWEANGPGGQFGDRIQEVHYAPFWYRRAEDTKTKKVTDKPGWWSTAETMRTAMGIYAAGLIGGEFLNVSDLAIRELSQYRNGPGGKLVHSQAEGVQDPAASGAAHGDVAIGDMVAVHLLRSHGTYSRKRSATIRPLHCFAARREARRAARRQEADGAFTWNP